MEDSLCYSWLAKRDEIGMLAPSLEWELLDLERLSNVFDILAARSYSLLPMNSLYYFEIELLGLSAVTSRDADLVWK